MSDIIVKKAKREPQPRARAPAALLAGALAAAAAALWLGAAAVWPQSWFGALLPRADDAAHTAQRFDAIEQRLAQLPQLQTDARAMRQMQTQLGEMQTRMDALRDALQKLDAQTKTDLAENARNTRELAAAQTEWRARFEQGAERYRLLEVEHLLALAVQRLHFETEPQLALRALRLGAQRLGAVPGAQFNAARAALAADIDALSRYPQADQEKLLRELGELAAQIESLPFPKINAPPKPTPRESSAEESWWRAFGKDVLADIANMVQVETDGDELPLTAAQKNITRARAQTMLDTAALALLRGRYGSFASQVQTAHAFIEKHFARESPQTRALLIELASLQARAPSPPPDISRSLQVLREAMRAQ